MSVRLPAAFALASVVVLSGCLIRPVEVDAEAGLVPAGVPTVVVPAVGPQGAAPAPVPSLDELLPTPSPASRSAVAAGFALFAPEGFEPVMLAVPPRAGAHAPGAARGIAARPAAPVAVPDGCPAPVVAGYPGPGVVPPARVVRHVPVEGESWSRFRDPGRGVDYAVLAAMNALGVHEVEAGRGLVLGRAVWLPELSGLGPAESLRFCRPQGGSGG